MPLATAVGAHAWRRRRWQRAGLRALHESRRAGLTEPASLHPFVNPNRCVGCGTCVRACPEGDVLGLVDGQAALVNPGDCIGHGECARSCPTDAITLVLGTPERGFEVPALDRSFQSNVPGMFVAGELGGMGLIRNAVEQGRQVIDAIRRLDGLGQPDRLDVAIVGAGPAGLGASLAARSHGLRCVTLEQESLGGTVAHYPRGKVVMTAPVELPIYGRLRVRQTTKEGLLALWHDVVSRTGLEIRCHERVETISRGGGAFHLRTTRGSYTARAVVLAIGRRGSPRKLGVPGEESSKVVYRLIEPEQYRGRRVLVVGGGDSALEAATQLAEVPGARVALCHRREAFSGVRPRNRARAESAAAARRLRLLLSAQVHEIRPRSVRVRLGPRRVEFPNDAVIVCIGGVLPSAFLRSLQVEVRARYGTPL